MSAIRTGTLTRHGGAARLSMDCAMMWHELWQLAKKAFSFFFAIPDTQYWIELTLNSDPIARIAGEGIPVFSFFDGHLDSGTTPHTRDARERLKKHAPRHCPPRPCHDGGHSLGPRKGLHAGTFDHDDHDSCGADRPQFIQFIRLVGRYVAHAYPRTRTPTHPRTYAPTHLRTYALTHLRTHVSQVYAEAG